MVLIKSKWILVIRIVLNYIMHLRIRNSFLGHNRFRFTSHFEFLRPCGDHGACAVLSDCDFSQWLAENKIKDGSPSILGFDCEWRPNFRPGSPENKVALIQLSTANSVFLYHIKHTLRGSPMPSLVEVMKSGTITKVGVGVLEDLKKLQQQYNIDYGAYWDVSLAARRTVRPLLQKIGLGQLLQEFYGIALPKPKKVQMSNWEMDPLSPDQMKYAAWDALCGVLLYDHLRLNSTAFAEVRRCGDMSANGSDAVANTSSSEDTSQHHYTIGPAIADLLNRGVHWNEELTKQLLREAAAESSEISVTDSDAALNDDSANATECQPFAYNATRANFRAAMRMAEESDVYVGVLCDFIARETLDDVSQLGLAPAQSLMTYCARLNCHYKIVNKAKKQAAALVDPPGAGQLQVFFDTVRVRDLIKRVGEENALKLYCPVDPVSSSGAVLSDDPVDVQLAALVMQSTGLAASAVLINGHLMGWSLAKSKMLGVNEVCRKVLAELFAVQRDIVASSSASPVDAPHERLVDLALLFAGRRRGTGADASAVGALPPEYELFLDSKPRYWAGNEKVARAGGAPGAGNLVQSAAAPKDKQAKLWSRNGDAKPVSSDARTAVSLTAAAAAVNKAATRVCKFYSSDKGCRLGDKCNFSHDIAGSLLDVDASLHAVQLSASCEARSSTPHTGAKVAATKVRNRTVSLGSVPDTAAGGGGNGTRKKKPKTRVADRAVGKAGMAGAPRVVVREVAAAAVQQDL